MMVFVRESFPLSTRMEEIVVSVVLVGAMLGAVAGGSIADRIGRTGHAAVGRRYLSGRFVARVLVTQCDNVDRGPRVAGNCHRFHFSHRTRVCLGAGAAAIAGPLIGLYQFALTIGIVLADLVGYWLAGQHAWRLMFGLGAVPAALLLVLVVTLPESPRWLYAQNRMAEVQRVLSSYTDEAGAKSLIEEIRAALAIPVEQRWSELWSPAVRTSLFIAVGFTVLQQVTGINTIIYYGPRIFALAGITSNRNAIFATLLVAVTNMLATIIALVLVDRVGRKPLLYAGLSGMTICLVLLAYSFHAPAAFGAAPGVVATDLPDGLHHLFRVQHGAHRVDPGIGGFSSARARPRRRRSVARLRRSQFPGLDDFSFAHQSRWLRVYVPDLCVFLRAHAAVCALHRPGDLRA